MARPFLFNGYIAQVGAHKGIMGSYAPINDLVFEWERIGEELPPEAAPAVGGDNLLGLLRKRGAL